MLAWIRQGQESFELAVGDKLVAVSVDSSYDCRELFVGGAVALLAEERVENKGVDAAGGGYVYQREKTGQVIAG